MKINLIPLYVSLYFFTITFWVNGETLLGYYFKEAKTLHVDPDVQAVFDASLATQNQGASVSVYDPLPLEHWYIAPVTLAKNAMPPNAFTSPVLMDEDNISLIISPTILVQFQPHVEEKDIEQILATHLPESEIIKRSWGGLSNAFKLHSNLSQGRVVLAQANQLAQLPEVVFAEPDFIIQGRSSLIPNDPLFNTLWGINQTSDFDIDAPEAWDLEQGSADIRVLVLDTGVQQDHPDLNQVTGEDFTSTPDGGFGAPPTDGRPFNECENHGTAVAGCISAIINNTLGVVGVAPGCKVVSARIGIGNVPCDGTWMGPQSWMVEALDWAETNGVRVTNNSNSIRQSAALALKYESTRNQGMVHFASSGNSGTSPIAYPASLSTVNAVGATQSDGTLASFSNFGTGLGFTAPGASIQTTDRTGSDGYVNGDYTFVDGTSFSSPYAAGVAALILSKNPTLNASEVEQIMQDSATDLGTPGYDTTFGWGMVNAFEALMLTPPPNIPPSVVSISSNPTDCASVTFTYFSSNGVLNTSTSITMEISTDQGSQWTALSMTGSVGGIWQVSYLPTPYLTNLTVRFLDEQATVDDNSGAFWSFMLEHCPIPSLLTGEPVSGDPCSPILIRYFPNEGPLQGLQPLSIHIGHDGWQDVLMPNPIMTQVSNTWEYLYFPPEGASEVNIAVNHLNMTWDNNQGQNWNFPINGCTQASPLLILDPEPEITYDIPFTQNNITFSGVSNPNEFDVLYWDHITLGTNASISLLPMWDAPSIPLTTGWNEILVCGEQTPGLMIASDQAGESAYASGWLTGSNGGTGFQAWTLQNTANAGHFVEQTGTTPNLSLPHPAWGMYANNSGTAEAIRAFNTPMTTGSVFQLDWDNNWIETGASVELHLENSAFEKLWSFQFTGGESSYQMTGTTLNLPWTGDGIQISFELVTPTTYECILTPIGGLQQVVNGTLNTFSNSTISHLRIVNRNAGAGEEYNLYFNNLRLESPSTNAPTQYCQTRYVKRIPYLDLDGDQLSDTWEQTYFSSLTNGIPEADSDLDGMTNLEEFLAGTDPTDASSLLMINSIVMDPQLNYPEITWDSIGNKTYLLSYASNELTNAFQPLYQLQETDVAEGVQDTATLIHTNVYTNEVRGFYRIQIAPDTPF